MTIYCIGIGGSGMSYVARLLLHEGHKVFGADMNRSSTVEELEQEGFQIFIGHKKEQVAADVDLVLISPALLTAPSEDLLQAQSLGIPVKTWQEYIGEKTKNMRTIAICGAHGKSTTTAMVGLLLEKAGLDPTVLIGTKMKEYGGKNIRLGKSHWLVIEADEFNENFLHYHPEFIVVTSYEVDHLDYYKTEEKYRDAFLKFFRQISQDPLGHIFYHGEVGGLDTIVHEAYGQQNGPHGVAHVSEIADGQVPPLQVSGEYNRKNAALVYALGKTIDINETVIEDALRGFSGTWRRQEYKGKTQFGSLVYDDYAHHPTEVRVTLEGFRKKFPDHKIVCLFQPHQYSRTRFFLEQFGPVFAAADLVLIPNIFASRDTEEDKRSVTPEDVAMEIRKYEKEVHVTGSIDATYAYIQKTQEYQHPDTLFITMGAGDITSLATKLVA